MSPWPLFFGQVPEPSRLTTPAGTRASTGLPAGAGLRRLPGYGLGAAGGVTVAILTVASAGLAAMPLALAGISPVKT